MVVLDAKFDALSLQSNVKECFCGNCLKKIFLANYYPAVKMTSFSEKISELA